MNPLIKELQNAEYSRVFGPTNSLGGQLVTVEREVARVQKAYREPLEWYGRKADEVRPSDIAKDISNAPMNVRDWIGTIIGLALLAASLWLPVSLILAVIGVPVSAIPGALLWVLPMLYGVALTMCVHSERKKAARTKAGGLPLAHHQEE